MRQFLNVRVRRSPQSLFVGVFVRLNAELLDAPLPVWVAGLIVLIAAGCAIVTKAPLTALMATNRPTWAVYLSLILIFPALAIALLKGGRIAVAAQRIASTAAIIAIAVFLIVTQRFIVLPFAAITLVIALPEINRQAQGAARAGTWIFGVSTIVTTWAIAAALEYITPLTLWISGQTPYTKAEQASVVFVAATIIAALGIFDWWHMQRSQVWDRLIAGAVAVAIVLAALRHDSGLTDLLHLFFYVGPIELVRQGQWLLWDVPSQYGFGMILANAIIPAKSAYAALMTLNRTLLITAAAALFIMLRAGSRSYIRSLFAGAIAIAAVFFVCGIYFGMVGAEHFPSVGPMRFIWCYLLLLIPFAKYAGVIRERPAFYAGLFVWVISFFGRRKALSMVAAFGFRGWAFTPGSGVAQRVCCGGMVRPSEQSHSLPPGSP